MYLIPLAAVALASCSNETTDSREQRTAANPGTALNIFPAVQGTTRGVITTDANLTQFRVIAKGNDNFYTTTTTAAPTEDDLQGSGIGKSFESIVKLNSSTGKWYIGESDGTYYWWKSKSMSASFTAYAPYDEGFAPATSYEVAADLANQKDIIVAYNSGTGADFTSGVPLNFQHVMSQVIIKALNKDAGKRRIEVAGVKLNNLKNTGTLTLPTSSTASGTFSWSSYTPWSLDNPITTYKDRGTSAVGNNNTTIVTLTSAATQLTDTPFLLMPQTMAKADLTAKPVTGAYFSVLIRVTNIENPSNEEAVYPTLNATATVNAKDYFAYVAVPVDIDWKPGYKYTYTLNFSKDGIGKVDPNMATENPGYDYPTGDPTIKPGEDIIDSPVQLFFTVTVEDWQDGGNSPLDM